MKTLFKILSIVLCAILLASCSGPCDGFSTFDEKKKCELGQIELQREKMKLDHEKEMLRLQEQKAYNEAQAARGTAGAVADGISSAASSAASAYVFGKMMDMARDN